MRKGVFLALLTLSALLILSSCTAGGGLLTVGGGVGDDESGVTSAFFMIFEGGVTGTPVEDAVVTINGTDLDNFGFGMYTTFLTDLNINSGEDVILEIQRGSTYITSTLVMPEKPVITAPAALAVVPNPVTAQWSSATNPDAFAIIVDDLYTAADGEYAGSESGTARSHTMSGVFDTASADSEFTLGAVNYTTSLAGAAADSEFEVESSTISPAFDPQ
jgi:hypothetical protein